MEKALEQNSGLPPSILVSVQRCFDEGPLAFMMLYRQMEDCPPNTPVDLIAEKLFIRPITHSSSPASGICMFLTESSGLNIKAKGLARCDYGFRAP